MNTVHIEENVITDIRKSVGQFPVESGGVLAKEEDDRITSFYYDQAAGHGERWYRPTTWDVERVVEEWTKLGFRFAGFLHSHPPGLPTLSAMDIVAAEQTMMTNQMDQIYMGILCDGELHIYLLTKSEGRQPEIVRCVIETSQAH